jgi:predicted PurR-regulated permease PerM
MKRIRTSLWKLCGICCILWGVFALFTPFTPGSWLIVFGCTILFGEEAVQRWLHKCLGEKRYAAWKVQKLFKKNVR